jgi:LmbE family N-acetylglucosaminyl deacetylase
MNWQAEATTSRTSREKAIRNLTSEPRDSSLRLVVLAAHPDDETIGASALLARFPSAQVLFLTDGAPQNTNLWPPYFSGSRAEYAQIRRQESETALAHAGISHKQISWLEGIDQEAIFEVPSLTAKLLRILREYRPHFLVTHPYEGGHPDHDSAALIAWLAAFRFEKEAPTVCEMTSYHARDGQCVTGEFLRSNRSAELMFELSEPDRKRKRKMMDAYQSQRLVLENFPLLSEKLRIAPEYDFSQPPHEGKLWYECMAWPMSSARWRELASAACSRTLGCSCG